MDFYGTRMVLWNIYEKLLWKSTNYTFYTPKIIQWNIIQADFMSNYHYGFAISAVSSKNSCSVSTMTRHLLKTKRLPSLTITLPISNVYAFISTIAKVALAK